MSDPKKLGEELRLKAAGLAFDANRKGTDISRLISELKDLGQEVLDLKSHNNDIAHAGGLLLNVIPNKLDEAVKQLILVVEILDRYSALP